MADCCNNEPNIVQIIGERGISGFNGWTPLLAVVSDGSRRVLQIAGWIGGTGNQPPYTNQYIGPTSIVSDISAAEDIRGGIGATGAAGADGEGWSPILAVIEDPGDTSRYVFQIVDWTGGGGVKPSVVSQYIGTAGIVNTPAAAKNIRGATGAAGAAGAPGTDVTDGRSKITADDTTLGYLKDKLKSSDGTISLVETNPGANETLEASTKSLASDQYAAALSGVTTSYVDVLTYTTPNDALTRKYQVNFSAAALIAELDGTTRVSAIHIGLYIDGSLIKEKSFRLLSIGGISISDNEISIQYAGAVLPNKIISIRVKKSNESPGGGNTVRLEYKSLSIFGIL